MPAKNPPTLRMVLLDRLDDLIARYHLHDGDPLVPVRLDPVLDEINAEIAQWWLPDPVHGIGGFLDKYGSITLNWSLYQPGNSGHLRRALGHEFGHIFLEHEGWFSLYEAEWQGAGRFGSNYKTNAERDADIVSSYLTIQLRALEMLKGKEPGYIGCLLDVPPPLVEVRKGIWRLNRR